MDWLAWIDTLMRGAAAALALHLAALVLRQGAASAAARLGTLLLLGLALQTVAGHPGLESHLPRPVLAPLVGVAVANAPLFWALSRALFRADGAAGRWMPAVWLTAFGLGAANVSLGCAARDETWAQLIVVLQRLLPLVCTIGALWAAAGQWRGDLVEPRRRLRLLIIVSGGLYTLAQLALRLGQPGSRLDGAPALIDTAMVLSLLLLISLTMTRMVDGLAWFLGPTPHAPGHDAAPSPAPAQAPASRPAGDADDDLVAERLQRALHQEQVWRQGELGIAALASRLGCPEYRLRRVIRERLGHGHFSAFINSHRVEAARAALADPARRQDAVLAIALEVGFQSIGPFNRAFKAATGLTPTDYRRQQLADS